MGLMYYNYGCRLNRTDHPGIVVTVPLNGVPAFFSRDGSGGHKHGGTKSLNYYRRYLGEYARDTSHLTALQHGFYTLLLDFQYAKECALPERKQQLLEIAKARGPKQASELQVVIDEFFPKGPNGRWNPRVFKELQIAHQAIEKMRQAGYEGASRRWGTPCPTPPEPYAKTDGVNHGVAIDPQSPIPNPRGNRSSVEDPSGLAPGPTSANRINGEEIQDVLNYLNDRTGRGFRWAKPNGKPTAHAEKVRALLKQGYTPAQFREVIDRQVGEWGTDEKMNKYLTPETLFRPSNFEKYLDS